MDRVDRQTDRQLDRQTERQQDTKTYSRTGSSIDVQTARYTIVQTSSA